MEPKDATKQAETTGDDFGFTPSEQRSIFHKNRPAPYHRSGNFVWGELDRPNGFGKCFDRRVRTQYYSEGIN
jgi:hypothetical protein